MRDSTFRAVGAVVSLGACVALTDMRIGNAAAIRLSLAPAQCTDRYTMQGQSMMPTVRNGQTVTIDRCVFRSRLPKRGDIILFKAVPAGQPDRLFVKRIVALPGEFVAVRASRVFINNRRLREPYVKQPAMYTFAARRVPPKSYFVLGDNRNNSFDSHLWLWLPARDIVGNVTVR